MNNTAATLEALRLPESIGVFDGLITSKTTKNVTIVETLNYDKRVNGKPTVTTEVKFRDVVDNTRSYFLNWIQQRINHPKVAISSESEDNYLFGYERYNAVLEHGYLAGTEVTFAGSRVHITGSGAVTEMTITTNVGRNVAANGQPLKFEDWVMTVRRERVIILGGKVLKPTVSNPNFKVTEVAAMLGITRDELDSLLAERYTIDTNVNTDTHIVSTACYATFERNGGVTTAQMHVLYNGIEQVPSGKITSYNKPYPGHVTRWRLYNGAVNNTAYGASEVVSQSPTYVVSDDKTIDGATLWATFEELPAQGKGWGSEAIYLLIDGAEPQRTY
jgi:hypothetical protein